MTIGEKIRIARHLRGYTQAELGSMVKLPGDMIRKYENDVRTPKPERLSLIAQKLDVDISSLWTSRFPLDTEENENKISKNNKRIGGRVYDTI